MRKSFENVIVCSSELLKLFSSTCHESLITEVKRLLLVIFRMIEGIQSFSSQCHFSTLLPPLFVHSPLVASVRESGRDEKKQLSKQKNTEGTNEVFQKIPSDSELYLALL